MGFGTGAEGADGAGGVRAFGTEAHQFLVVQTIDQNGKERAVGKMVGSERIDPDPNGTGGLRETRIVFQPDAQGADGTGEFDADVCMDGLFENGGAQSGEDASIDQGAKKASARFGWMVVFNHSKELNLMRSSELGLITVRPIIVRNRKQASCRNLKGLAEQRNCSLTPEHGLESLSNMVSLHLLKGVSMSLLLGVIGLACFVVDLEGGLQRAIAVAGSASLLLAPMVLMRYLRKILEL